MWSASQLFFESSNARSEALELFTILGLDFTPALINKTHPAVQLDPEFLYDIPDGYAGLVVIYNFLVQCNVLSKTQIFAVLKLLKDKLIPIIENLFNALNSSQDITPIDLIMAISDRKFVALWPRPVTLINLNDWSTTGTVTPAPVEGVSYNLALLLEKFWEENHTVISTTSYFDR